MRRFAGPLEDVAAPGSGPSVTVDGATKQALGKATLGPGALGLPPRPPAEEARLAGRRVASRVMRRDRPSLRRGQ